MSSLSADQREAIAQAVVSWTPVDNLRRLVDGWLGEARRDERERMGLTASTECETSCGRWGVCMVTAEDGDGLWLCQTCHDQMLHQAVSVAARRDEQERMRELVLDGWLLGGSEGHTEAVCELSHNIADADYSECEDDTEAAAIAADIALEFVAGTLAEDFRSLVVIEGSEAP